MTESPQAGMGDVVLDDAGFIDVNVSEIPEHYVSRTEKSLLSPAGPLIRLMGIQKRGDVITLPTGGVQARLRAAGLTTNFDLVPASEGIIEHPKYLQHVTDAEGPLGNDRPHTMLHDLLFHGVGFEALDQHVTSVVQEAARYSLSTGNQITVSQCVFVIDGLTSAFLASTVDGPESLHDALVENLLGIKNLWSAPVPGESMFESTRRSSGMHVPDMQIEELATNQVRYYDELLSRAEAIERQLH